MNDDVLRLNSARDLPPDWDRPCVSLFQKRAFLEHCEIHNPCRQRYYVSFRKQKLTAGAVVYSLPVDLLSFRGLRSPVGMQIVGIPCSVSAPGLIGPSDAGAALLSSIHRAERGLVLALNLDDRVIASGFTLGRTWPGMVLENSWGSFDEYTASLRSVYRRRLVRIRSWMEGLDIRTGPCSAYTEPLHRMYETVHARSEAKLEKLGPDFFRNLPEPFRLTTFTRSTETLGWVITALDGENYSFFLGGQTCGLDARNLYLAQLVTVVRMGIESGARRIDLGQTAEVPKARMGARPVELGMLGAHTSPLLNQFLRASAPLLSNRRPCPRTHVFRGGPP